MLSTSIKNFVLVVLIILIVHFIIKNHLIENYQSIKSTLDMSKVVIPVFDPINATKKKPENFTNNEANKVENIIESNVENIIENSIKYDKVSIDSEKKKQLDQLYDFVYQKDESSVNFDPAQVSDVKEYNNEDVSDKDELFNGISGYNSGNDFSLY
jgi:hypothetical protein